MTGITLNIEILIVVMLSLLLVNVFLIKWMFSQYKIEVDDHEGRLRVIERGWITAESWRSQVKKILSDIDELRDEVREFKSEVLSRLKLYEDKNR